MEFHVLIIHCLAFIEEETFVLIHCTYLSHEGVQYTVHSCLRSNATGNEYGLGKDLERC